MKTALLKNSLLLLITISIILCCQNNKEKLKENHVYKQSINKKDFIDSINLFSNGTNFKVILNKVFTKRNMIYEIEIINSQKKISKYNLPYHFISGKDTLQPDDLGLSKATFNFNHDKEEVKNGFIVDFWQSETQFQYMFFFNGANFNLKTIKRISEQPNLKLGIKICDVQLNQDLKNLNSDKIDLILNSFDNNINQNCY